MSERERGSLKFWNPDRCFGFIARAGAAPDVYLNPHGLADGTRVCDLLSGTLVTFNVVKGTKGLMAADLATVRKGRKVD